ncbi:MAG: thioredoxin family protein [Deltaproteobacteria bacterium]|nr:thioredoxin family protein [Deltaproteobacteria bacterium]
MTKKRNFFKWSLLILGIVIAGGLWGMGDNEKPLLAQPLLDPPTNTGKELKNALQSGQPVLVDFGSNKCIPCRQIRPILKEIEKEYDGKAHVLIIDVFENRELARGYRIQLIPTLVFFNRSGKEVFRRSGTWDKNSIARKLREAGIS